IGSGNQRTWLGEYFKTHPQVIICYSDVDDRASVDLYCGAHDLPFEAGVFQWRDSDGGVGARLVPRARHQRDPPRAARLRPYLFGSTFHTAGPLRGLRLHAILALRAPSSVPRLRRGIERAGGGPWILLWAIEH